MMKHFSALAIAAAFWVPAASAETTLVFGAGTPPQGPIHESFVEWVAAVNADGAGVLQIDYREGFTMANPGNFYDRVKDGVVEIAWGTLTAIGGRFPLSSVVELPYVTTNAETSSVAFWRMYDEGFLDAEFHDIVPLITVVFPQSPVHLREPIDNLDSLAGLQIIAGTETNAAVISALGAVPLSIGLADAYEAIQRGTADGRIIPWSAFPAFRLAEVTNYHIEAPIGTVVGMVFINREVWNGLSDAERDVLMRNSGEARSRSTAQVVDNLANAVRARIAGSEGHSVVEPSPEQAAAWRERLAPVETDWIARTEGGAAFLERYSALIAEIGGGN